MDAPGLRPHPGPDRPPRASLSIGSIGCQLVAAILVLLSLRAFGQPNTSSDLPLLPPDATVLLMSGLPGDLESETSYRRQMRDWLAWLATQSPPPQRVLVLADPPEPPPQGTPFPVITAPARRDALLALGPELASANRFLALVWGHGGMQGTTPVFHVRGPRVTPADLAALAGQLPDVPGTVSRWILLFRGSGRFAGALAGGTRCLLTSEHATPFPSDPQGPGLLLPVLRSNPSNSLPDSAAAFGKAVAEWYESRQLARTEEPSLWLPGQEPRRLAGPDTSPALAATTPTPSPVTPLPTPTTPSPTNPPPAPTASVPAGIPADWNDIARVDSARFPDADAVVLRRRQHLTLTARPTLEIEHEDFIQILTPEGREAGDLDLQYLPPQEEVVVLDCEVLPPDGPRVRLDPEAIRDGGEAPVGDYPAVRRKFFSLPGVVPGAILHVRYRREWREFPMPRVALPVPVADDAPLLDAAVEITVPREDPFHFELDRLPATEPRVSQTAHGTTYAWRFRDLPALPVESLAPPAPPPAVLISTWPDWKAYAEWYDRVTRFAREVTPELTAKAAELTRDTRTNLDKVRAIQRYVTRLRYVMVPLGVNSYRPHAAANVLRNQFGDCKDKANLFNALLGTLGIPAHLVLVPRFSQAHPGVPGQGLNHALSRVALGGETLWIDTTDSECPPGMLPPGDSGRRVLVIDGTTTNLVELPAPLAADHRLQLDSRLQWPVGDQPAPVTLRIHATGLPAYELRRLAGAPGARRSHLPLPTPLLRGTSGDFVLRRQQVPRASAPDDACDWEAEGEALSLAGTVGSRPVLRPPFWIPREWELALQPRRQPLHLNEGYPLILEETLTISRPPAGRVETLPPIQENTSAPLRWRLEWVRTPEEGLEGRFRVELVAGDLPAAAVPEFQVQLRACLAALANTSLAAVVP